MTVAAASGCALLWLAWAPLYVTWPWWNDLDHFSTFAQGWDQGLLPYRDLPTFQFPGEYYLYWALGKLFGWGTTWPIYAADAGLALALVLAMAGWSKKVCGRSLPGWLGGLAFLGYYLGLGFDQAAQRDFHAPALAAMGVMAAQAVPGVRGRLLAGLLAGASLSIRPHAAVFLPAMAAAVAWGARGSAWRKLGALAAWGAATALALAVAFAPVWASGLWPSFLGNLRVATGPLNTLTRGNLWTRFFNQTDQHARLLAVPAGALLLAAGADPPRRRVALTWVLAVAGAAWYKPPAPVPHDYLTHGLMVAWGPCVAALAMLLLSARGLTSPPRLAALLLLAAAAIPGRPAYARPGEALAAILRPEARGGLPERRPLHTTLPDPYTWRGYRALIAYLRDHTAPRTRVANCLAFMPAVCGPAGRLPAMPGESLAWFQYFKDDENLQNAYARRLAETPDSVVVWSPAEAPTIPGPLLAVIRGAYEPSARFGPVEVWRRRPGGPPVSEK